MTKYDRLGRTEMLAQAARDRRRRDMTALQELLAKVEAGVKYETMGHTLLCQKAFPKPEDFDGSREAYANSNAQLAVLAWRNGSLDAAKALHKAVLLGYYVAEMGNNSKSMGWSVRIVNTEGDYQSGIGGSNLARAWLIAIIKALIAQEATT